MPAHPTNSDRNSLENWSTTYTAIICYIRYLNIINYVMCFQKRLLHLKPSRISLSLDLLKKVQMQILFKTKRTRQNANLIFSMRTGQKANLILSKEDKTKCKIQNISYSQLNLLCHTLAEWRKGTGKTRHPGNSDRNSAANWFHGQIYWGGTD